MKKGVLVLALLAIVATGAFAQGFYLAVGGGGLFDYSLNNGLKKQGIYAGFNILSFGASAFFDATYAEMDVSFSSGSYTLTTKPSSPKEKAASALQLGFTILGKFPIGLGGITISPLMGGNYNMLLSATDPSGSYFGKLKENNQLGLLAGVGLDFNFSRAIFLRTETMFSFRFPSKAFKNEAVGGTKATFGMSPRIKIGVGFKLVGAGEYRLVNADTLNVRSKPSADSSVVGVLARNDRVEVLDKSGTWWKIKSGTIQGYVNSAYLKAAN